MLNTSQKSESVTSRSLPQPRSFYRIEESTRRPKFENLHWNQKRDISALVQISSYFTLSRMIVPLITAAGIILIWLIGKVVLQGDVHVSSVESICLRISLLGFIIYLSYLEMWRRELKAEIDGFVIQISSGVFRRRRLSFPLTPFVTVTLEQTKGERAFGYYSVVLRSVNFPGSGTVVLPAIKKECSLDLSDFIVAQSNRTSSIAQPIRGRDI
jgi:uncharacterized membrane protein YdbT with pleckstrin-like domain